MKMVDVAYLHIPPCLSHHPHRRPIDFISTKRAYNKTVLLPSRVHCGALAGHRGVSSTAWLQLSKFLHADSINSVSLDRNISERVHEIACRLG